MFILSLQFEQQIWKFVHTLGIYSLPATTGHLTVSEHGNWLWMMCLCRDSVIFNIWWPSTREDRHMVMQSSSDEKHWCKLAWICLWYIKTVALRFCEEENKLINQANPASLQKSHMTNNPAELESWQKFPCHLCFSYQDFRLRGLGGGPLGSVNNCSFCSVLLPVIPPPPPLRPFHIHTDLFAHYPFRLPGGMSDTIRSDPGLLGSREGRQAG